MAISGSAQRCRVRSSVSCTPGDSFEKCSSTPSGRDRRIAGAQRHDLALAGLGEFRGGAADETGIAIMLLERGAALTFPAGGFQRQEYLDRGGDLLRGARHLETDFSVFGQPVALAAQLLQFLRSERIAQHFIGVARRIEAGAEMGLQQARAHAVMPQHFRESSEGGAIERDVAQDQRMGAGFSRLADQPGGGVLGQIAIEWRRAERTVGVGTDQGGKGDSVGAPHRDRGQQADQARRAVGRR